MGLTPRSLLAFQRSIVDRLVVDRDPPGALRQLCRELETQLGGGVCFVRSRGADGRSTLTAGSSASAELVQDLQKLETRAGTTELDRPRFVADTLKERRPQRFPVAERHGLRASWSLPVRVREDSELLGALECLRPIPGLPRQDEQEALEVAAHLAGLVLESLRQEEQLGRGNQLLRNVVEACQDAIFAKDTEGRYVVMNSADARHFGRPAQELLGKTDFELFGEEEARQIRAMDRRAMEERRTVSHEQHYPTWSERDRAYHVSRSPMLDRDGQVVGVAGIVRDVTDLRRAEEAMRRSQHFDSLGVLAGGIAHDFNNLLVGVLGNADLLLHELPADSPFRAAIADIDRAAEEGSKLCAQLMSYAGRGEVAAQEVNLHDIVHEATRLLASSRDAKVRVELDLDETAWSVTGDRTQLAQIVVNLIRNAVEANEGEAGRVIVRTRRRDVRPQELMHSFLPEEEGAVCCLVLEVEDTGCGMSPEQMQRAFDPFVSSKESGHGLGLAAVLGTLNRHGGGVSVDSVVGEGTTFRVALPSPVRRPARRPEADSLPPSERPQVLLVDDEEVAREVGRRMLQLGGYDVVCCQSGEDALRWAQTAARAPRFAVLDHRMPGLSGVETMERLSQVWPKLSAMLVSGDEDDVRRVPLPATIKGCLGKPFRTQEFLDAVRVCDPSAGVL